MARIIASKTKSNELKVRRQLENSRITIVLSGLPNREMTGAEALLWGRELLQSRQLVHSCQLALQLIQRHPKIVDTHILYLQSLILQDDLLKATNHARILLLEAPNNSGILTQSAKVSLALGNADDALSLFKKAYVIEKKTERTLGIGVLLLMAECYVRIGETHKAVNIYTKVLVRVENSFTLKESIYLPALLGAFQHNLLNDFQRLALSKELEDTSNDIHLRANIAYGFANHFAEKKDVASEIKALNHANTLLRDALQFTDSINSYETWLSKQVNLNIKIFSEPAATFFTEYSSNPKFGDYQPISIIGMPRSGTTLLEQMLGSHSLVGQVGESKALSVAINQAYEKHHIACSLDDYPIRASSFPVGTLNTIADTYVEFQKLLTDKAIFVEKELSSFRFVGITANLFPQAKFIHMNRSPLDIFLSCYRGSIVGIPPTCSVEHMAIYYIYMKKLIGHWKSIYPDRVYILDYSELVSDPEKNMRKLIKFLGLEWEDSILNFHKRKNVVRTLSVNQVRKGIYKSSVKKWEPFKEMLQPAISILEDRGIDLDGVATL